MPISFTITITIISVKVLFFKFFSFIALSCMTFLCPVRLYFSNSHFSGRMVSNASATLFFASSKPSPSQQSFMHISGYLRVVIAFSIRLMDSIFSAEKYLPFERLGTNFPSQSLQNRNKKWLRSPSLLNLLLCVWDNSFGITRQTFSKSLFRYGVERCGITIPSNSLRVIFTTVLKNVFP